MLKNIPVCIVIKLPLKISLTIAIFGKIHDSSDIFSGNANIQNRIASKVVEFGDNVTLFCSILHFNIMSKHLKWTRGEDNELLTFDGDSINSTKFVEIKKRSGFGLIIINLTEEDINMLYTCFYEFQNATTELTVNIPNFQCKYAKGQSVYVNSLNMNF